MKRNRRVNPIALATAILCAAGLALAFFSIGAGSSISFDVLTVFEKRAAPPEIVVLTMDESLYEDPELNAGYHYPDFNRATHARLLEKLRADGSNIVVFDIYFKYSQPEDGLFAAAITNHGKVIIAAELEENPKEFGGYHTNDPVKTFVDLPGCEIGLPEVDRGVIRTFPLEGEYLSSIPRLTAEAFGHKVDPYPAAPRWVAFYGDRNKLSLESYQSALDRPPGYFKGKAVFVGGKPKIKFLTEPSDEFETPWTRWSGEKMRGVEIHATMFGNLIHNEALTEMSRFDQGCLVLLAGILFGWIFSIMRPVPALWVLTLGALGVLGGAVGLLWSERLWFNWVLIGWIEIPVAWVTSAVIYVCTMDREKEALQKEVDTLKSAGGAVTPSAPLAIPAPIVLAPDAMRAAVAANVQLGLSSGSDVSIPNYELLKLVGEGAYGQVWLARNKAVRIYRAIKIIFRKNFSELRPFEREFEGVSNFVGISENHSGWVTVHDVGKNDSGGFFYYAMEAADDVVRGPEIDPESYAPKTLSKLLVENEHLAVLECIDLGVEMASALGALHGARLVHRDVKPSNIIFAKKKPKLADIGLVAHMDEQKSINGTEGFMPNENLGTPSADIFGLGRVLYVAATGCAPTRHPELPTSLGVRNDARELMLLMKIINKACAPAVQPHYDSALELRDDLLTLRRQFVDVGI